MILTLRYMSHVACLRPHSTVCSRPHSTVCSRPHSRVLGRSQMSNALPSPSLLSSSSLPITTLSSNPCHTTHYIHARAHTHKHTHTNLHAHTHILVQLITSLSVPLSLSLCLSLALSLSLARSRARSPSLSLSLSRSLSLALSLSALQVTKDAHWQQTSSCMEELAAAVHSASGVAIKESFYRRMKM